MPHKVEKPKPYMQWLDNVVTARTEEPQSVSNNIQAALFPTPQALSERDPTDWNWEDFPCDATIVLLCGVYKDGSMAISCIPNPDSAGMGATTLDDVLLTEIAGFWHKGSFNRNMLFEWQNEEKLYGIEVLYSTEVEHESDRKRWYKLATGIDPDVPVDAAKVEANGTPSGKSVHA